MESREAWRGVAEAIVRRRAERNWTQMDLAKRGPLSIDRVQSMESARRTSYRAATVAAMERALEWKHGSIEAILRGEPPQEIRGMQVEYHFTDEQVREMARRLPAEAIREIYRESEAVPDDSAEEAPPPTKDWRDRIREIEELSPAEQRLAIGTIEALRRERDADTDSRRRGSA